MNASSLSFQDIILRLQQYWGEQGCVIMQPYDSEVAGINENADQEGEVA